MRRDRGEERWHLSDRGGEEDEIGIAELRGPRIVEHKTAVDDAKPVRRLDIASSPTDADDTFGSARALHRQRERASDQSDANHHELADAHHPYQRPSADSSAARKRRFSSGKPTVTRRCSGNS